MKVVDRLTPKSAAEKMDDAIENVRVAYLADPSNGWSFFGREEYVRTVLAELAPGLRLAVMPDGLRLAERDQIGAADGNRRVRKGQGADVVFTYKGINVIVRNRCKPGLHLRPDGVIPGSEQHDRQAAARVRALAYDGKLEAVAAPQEQVVASDEPAPNWLVEWAQGKDEPS